MINKTEFKCEKSDWVVETKSPIFMSIRNIYLIADSTTNNIYEIYLKIKKSLKENIRYESGWAT